MPINKNYNRDEEVIETMKNAGTVDDPTQLLTMPVQPAADPVNEAPVQGSIYDGFDINNHFSELLPAGIQEQTVIDKDFLTKAQAKFNQYRGYKAELEGRIMNNERWYKMQYQPMIERDSNGYKVIKSGKKRTGWLFNAIDNKHADFMDNFPDMTVKPRERSDEQAASELTSIIPVILERNNFKQIYSDNSTEKAKNGCGIYYIFWDPDKEDGMGDIAIKRVDPLNIFWESGIDDIQDSEAVFLVELMRNDALKVMYPDIPELKDHLSTPGLAIPRYFHNQNIDTSEQSYVVNMYYKRMTADGKAIVHLLKYVNDVILFASENDPQYVNGWYEHGMYPFVFDTLYKETGSPFGFGLIDVNKDTQSDLDDLNKLIVDNAKIGLRRRYFVNGNAINEKEFADLDNELIHVAGSVDERTIREIEPVPMGASYIEVYNQKINEIKEISSNRDITAGGTGGTSTASGIAALQETGNKTSRAMISNTYNAFKKICEMIIELIRQFYDIARSFRITAPDGTDQFIDFSNEAIRGGLISNEFGVEFKTKRPVFDLDVKPFKLNPYSKAAQNQDAINFYGMGLFNPQNDIQSLACLEMLEFEGKDKVKAMIQQNGQTYQLMNQVLPLLLSAFAAQNPQGAAQIAAQFGINMPMAAPMGGEAPAEEDGKAEQPARTDSTGKVQPKQHSIVEQARERAAASAAARG